MKKILIIFGTRPEAIKMVPLIKTCQKQPDMDVKVCVTAQHRQMLDQVLHLFHIIPDYDLDIMKAKQDLYTITSSALLGLKSVLEDFKPDLVLVHGDTTTTMAGALAAFYQQIPIGHVEAGLRTYDIYSPWPEEANRQLTSRLATYHFAPTQNAKENLLKEGNQEHNILVTGNTVIDALHLMLEMIQTDASLQRRLQKQLSSQYPFDDTRKIILVTGHRRENFGQDFINIFNALKKLALDNPSVDIVYPVHLNPNVHDSAHAVLNGIKNIYLIDPLEYAAFVYLMSKAYLIITDSGGIQEEAPSLGKPVLVTRKVTERPEGLISGTVKLVGTKTQTIVEEAQRLLDDTDAYRAIQNQSNVYGDGNASMRIVTFLRSHL